MNKKKRKQQAKRKREVKKAIWTVILAVITGVSGAFGAKIADYLLK